MRDQEGGDDEGEFVHGVPLLVVDLATYALRPVQDSTCRRVLGAPSAGCAIAQKFR
jgi:hypothetical protein